MALDGIVLRALIHELTPFVGARIHKIHQPFERDLVFHLRGRNGAGRLLLSASPTYPRLHLTERRFENPIEPPMFCMLLRKHCENGIIEAIEQPGLERMVTIDVRHRNELGDISMKRIIIEIMGRHSNIILIDPASGTIVDSIHHIQSDVNRHRIVMPGAAYVLPPEQHKLDPLVATSEEIADCIRHPGENVTDMNVQARRLVERYAGISPLFASEIVHRGADAWEHLSRTIRQHEYDPVIVNTKQQSYFSVVRLTHLAGREERMPSAHACLDRYYSNKAEKDRIKERVGNLYKWLQNEKSKNKKKWKKLKSTLEKAKDADQFRVLGELLTASLHEVTPGMSEIEVVNYYDEEQGKVKIALDPRLSPSENAQRYFKTYNKSKNSMAKVTEQIKRTEEEIAYLESLEQQLDNAELADVEEIREELVEQGYLRKRASKGKSRKSKADTPALLQFVSSEGVPIYVGKNNKQNDYLTQRLARSDDTWLHTKDIPGSHVVIRSRQFGETTLQEAATLAAYFSKGRSSSQVPVDYTLIRHVRKPNGAKPGFVIYDRQKTLFITPDEQQVERLKSSRES